MLKTHGVKGELLIKTVFEISDNYELAELIFLEIEGLLVPFFIEEYTVSSNHTIITKLSDVDNKNKAVRFVDCNVFIEITKLKTQKVEFSASDLIGFSVLNQDGKNLGKIIDFMDIPGNFLITVMFGNKEILVPFNEHVLIDFNKPKKQVTLDIQEGLVDL